jgi:hypothetical protein
MTSYHGVVNRRDFILTFSSIALASCRRFAASAPPPAPDVPLQSSSYAWFLSLRPQFTIAPGWSVGMRQDRWVEWLDPARHVRLGDLWSEVRYTGVLRKPGIQPWLALRMVFPLSDTSRRSGTYATPGFVAGAHGATRYSGVGQYGAALKLIGMFPIRGSRAYESTFSPAWTDCQPVEEHLDRFCQRVDWNDGSRSHGHSLSLMLSQLKLFQRLTICSLQLPPS